MMDKILGQKETFIQETKQGYEVKTQRALGRLFQRLFPQTRITSSTFEKVDSEMKKILTSNMSYEERIAKFTSLQHAVIALGRSRSFAATIERGARQNAPGKSRTEVSDAVASKRIEVAKNLKKILVKIAVVTRGVLDSGEMSKFEKAAKFVSTGADAMTLEVEMRSLKGEMIEGKQPTKQKDLPPERQKEPKESKLTPELKKVGEEEGIAILTEAAVLKGAENAVVNNINYIGFELGEMLQKISHKEGVDFSKCKTLLAEVRTETRKLCAKFPDQKDAINETVNNLLRREIEGRVGQILDKCTKDIKKAGPEEGLLLMKQVDSAKIFFQEALEDLKPIQAKVDAFRKNCKK